jgi:lysophospholipase L1-like esterase
MAGVRHTIKIAVLVLLAAVAAPATASAKEPPKKPQTRYYLALGDSLTAGYQQDPAGAPVFSKQKYVDQVFRRARKRNPKLRLINLGCPGENFRTFRQGGCPYPLDPGQRTAQQKRALALIKKHRGRISFITVSLGNNEFTPCSSGNSVDVTCALAGLESLRKQLPVVARTLRKAAGKNVKIAVHTFYNPYLALALQGGAYRDLALASATLAEQVNIAIRDAVFASRLLIADVAKGFKSQDPDTDVAVGEVCRLTQACLPLPQGNIHPSDAGYTVMAREFIKTLKL